MALITCLECTNSVSDLAEACPKCGYPLLKTEYTFVEVYLNSETGDTNRGFGERQLEGLMASGWELVDTHDFVDNEGFDITKYKLQRKSRTTHP